ncbi:TapB family protein [Frigoriglobus tundricola]|uniref:DUF3108 domain-containing protein n=1 Tax=Frigoriglobus tundricola TaxID=2774151 RepID=A0A6M5YGN3_9BACT|nr:hypothetical protein [Frigoriglobus tundricola]QJW93187.1 hypothetical protein FTUN_0692 [Frigoriglobus tundricola]
MYRCVPCLVAMVLGPVALAAAPAPVPKAAQKPKYYCPTKLGTKWVYKGDNEERIEEVTAVEKKENGVVITVGVLVGEKIVPYSKTLVSDKGLFFGTSGLDEKAFPHCLLKLPSKSGDEWGWEVAEIGRKVTRVTRDGEEVEVPAGKFQTVRVDSEVPIGKQGTQKTTEWYAPEVGLVKSVTRFGGAEDVRTLKSFTPGKD